MGTSQEVAGQGTNLPDLMRGVGAGVILGTPLVYTQEVWLHARSLQPFVIAGLVALTFGVNLAFSHVVGFSKGRIQRPVEDAIVGLGLSLLLAAALLALIDRVDMQTDPVNTLGLVCLCAIPISIGFALGNALAPGEGPGDEEELEGGAGDLLAAAGGAIVLCLNIAPTEEPVLLAAQIGWVRLVILVGVSLVLSYALVFYADFGGRERRSSTRGAAHGPLVETGLAYIVALGVSALLLWVFGRFQGTGGADVAEVIVLAFPAAMGAALGRLLV